MAKFLDKIRGNKYVDWAFYGLRPCVLALIASALLSLLWVTVINDVPFMNNILGYLNWKAILIFVLVYAMLNTRKLRRLHPVVFLAISAVMGIALYSI